jgi:magnesium-transporting ATPase (P-type)
MKSYQILSRLPILTCIFNLAFYSLINRTENYDGRIGIGAASLAIVCMQVIGFYFVYFKEVLNMERKWNKMEILRLTLSRNSVHSKSIKISELKVGDVVYLKGDTISPADIMVIDTSNQRHSDKIFHVSERRITGDNKIMTKSAIRNLNPQKSDKAPRSISNIGGKQHIPDMADKILKKFNGYVEYDAPNSFTDFVGSFRLKNDPRVSKVNKDNILYCGTKLYTTWIIGMVIYNGFYTKIMQRNYNQQLFSKDLLKFKKSVIYKMIDRVALVSFYCSLVITLIILIMLVANDADFKRLQAINERGPNQEFFWQLCFQLSYSFDVIPLTLYILYDLACFFSSSQIENLWEKLYLSTKSAIKAYYTALQIKCKKKAPRSGRKDGSQFSRTNTADKVKSAVIRGNSRKGTHQSAEIVPNSHEQAGPESGRLSPNQSGSKNPGEASTRSAVKKTTIGFGGKTNLIQGSDIISPGASDLIKIIDYGVISDLGCIDHVVFDKTDTLTTSHLEIVRFASVSRCYNIEGGNVSEKMVEITTPGNNLALNDSQDEEIKERGSYSEKSQEYLDELEGDYRAEVCEEDSTWTAMIRGLEQPSYNLDVGAGNGSNANPSIIDQSMGESPAMKNNPQSSVTAFFNERGKTSRKTGQGGDDFLNISNQNNSTKRRNTVLRGLADEKGHTKSVIALQGDLHSSRNIGGEPSEKESDEVSSVSDSFKLLLKPSKVLPLDKFIRDIYFKKEEIEQFLAMITLFNRFTLEGERNSKAQAMEDKAIADLLKNIGYQLSSSKKNKEATIDSEFRIKCSTTNHTVDYRVVGVNFFSHYRERASIVFHDTSNNSGEAYILVKGVERSMVSLMSMTEKEKNIMRELSSNMKSQGLKMIVYGIKKLNYEEVLSYRGSYQEIMKSPRDQKEGFELLALDVEKNLKFIGCFGIRDNVCPEGLAFSQVMRDIGIKFSILSGDNKDNCLNIARTLELTKSGTEESGITFNIASTEEEEIESSMKRIIDQIYEDMKKLNQDEMKRADRELPNKTTELQMALDNIKQRLFKTTGDSENDWQEEVQEFNFEFDPLSFRNLTKRTLVLNGESINKIVNSQFLLTQLRCIMLFCSSIVGYSMQPSHKATIVKLLRSNNSVVLAVGDGFNDIRMIREANVGVQLSNSDVPVVFSDIVVGSIGVLKKVMFSKAAGFGKNLITATLALFWIILTHLYLYSVLYINSTHLSELFRVDTKVLRMFFIVLLCCTCLFDEPYKADCLSAFPIIYRENVITRRHFRILFLAIILLGLIEISLVYSIYIFFLSNSYTTEGYSRGILFFENFLTLVSTTSACIKIYLLRNDRSAVFTISLLVIAIVMFPVVLVENKNAKFLDTTDFAQNFVDYAVLTCMIWAILLPSIINWLVITLLQENYISYLVNHLSITNKLIEKHPDKNNFKKVGTQEKLVFLNESLKEVQQRRYLGTYQVTNLVNLVRKITLGQPMSVSIAKIISIDLFNYQIGLKKFSNYITERVERSKFRDYLMHIMRKNTRTQMILYLLIYISAFIVGIATPKFREMYMLDTFIPFMILLLSFILWINGSSIYYLSLFKFFIGIGAISFVISLIFSSITSNTFELNFLDFYNGRIWFSVCLEMMDSLVLVLGHLAVRITT